ncbi:phosphomethylpyrimidine kinase [Erythrobacter longus]|uniref:hydroxymethylpyrimidine kinase n=1 Tax=Erythrobacter longus TaxID=1044 RepID=A0A074M2M7_ERYLO|nr:bifunctional hydroxymethylpyrimidine kinase/phosphomethylpyrimidine kinase [Erythrobacter longus]KEO88686.1 phosphomethylpyrimidine kinase [Erythrobacter longus]
MASPLPAPPRILTIAGSDSSGGAGIQADIKTITMLGGYAMSAITSVTAQNTCSVTAVESFPQGFVAKQIEACAKDIGVDAIKIGMLASEAIVREVGDSLHALKLDTGVPLVIDPVMVATSGHRLIDESAVEALRGGLLRKASLVTPNLAELELLSGRKIGGVDEMCEAAIALAAELQTLVLAKGGHLEGDVVDILVDAAGELRRFADPRIESDHTHGTGCTLSSAIATLIGRGESMEEAVTIARQFVRSAIMNAPGFGAGNGPLGHQAVRR